MRNRMLIWRLRGGGAFVLLVITILAVVVTVNSDQSAEFGFSDRVQVVDLEGEIVDSRSVIQQLQRYQDSNTVRAILLNIDSPGGGVAVSQEINAEVKRIREKKNK